MNIASRVSKFRRVPQCRVACIAAVALLTLASPPLAAGQGTSQPTAQMQQLVNDLELQFQLTYRGHSRMLDERRAELQDALEAWNASRRTDADLRVMQQWLREAVQATLPGVERELPPTPEFAAPPAIAQRPAPQRPTNNLPAPQETPPAERIVESPAQPRKNRTREQEETPEQPTEPKIVAAPPKTTAPAQSTAPPEPKAPPLLSLDRHPAAAELAWGNPFVDDPAPSGKGESSKRRTVAFRPESKDRPQIRVNLSELSSRIRGYTQGLDFIEAELIGSPSATGFQLAGLARELESLQSQRELIDLYFARLSEIERMSMEEVPSPSAVIELLASRVKSRQQAVANSRSGAPSVVAERAVLDGLQMKLQQLGGEAERG